MFFHSITSLIIFLPIIFLSYPIIKEINRNIANKYLLLFSLIFYSFDTPWFIIPLLISAISDYFVSKELIENKKEINSYRICLLLISIFINIGLLIIFKYQDFISNILGLLGNNLSVIYVKNIILPAGISFYTFQTLSFTIDSYKREIKKIPSFSDYLLYVSYFPQLVAGPILRPSEFFNKNSKPKLINNYIDIRNGFNRICYGLFLKLCLADELANLNDIAFETNYFDLGFFDTWTMAFGFGLQIYFDFSAYSHMAIGVSKIIGLNIKENFIFPYSSISATEFWRKWHISLSKWVGDYLYSFLNKILPLYLMGSIPLLITWSLMGLWHGSSLRFAIWGTLNGILILIHRIIKNIDFKFLKIIINNKFISWLITLFSLMSTWIYFRSTSWEQANHLYSNLLRVDKTSLGFQENYYLIVFIFSVFTFSFGFIYNSKYFNYISNNIFINFLGTILALSFALIFINTQNSFIYFQF